MKRKQYYETCPICGANLDPGEHCDCMIEVREHQYPVTGCAEDGAGNVVPVIDIPQISDEAWMKRANSPENQRMLSEQGIRNEVAAL